uniref:Pinin/SDK/MemA protein domain-containing protein n=1 Tax=Angiostrongylus cantonensis TaxID=6313 RepID=A0A158P7X6_ANGCA
MERECRHSKEEEEELDRKIAQIREKNQKIVERRKVMDRVVLENQKKFAEIDAELAIHSDELLRKPSKMTKGSRLEGRVSGLPFEANSYSRRGRGSGGARAQQNRRTTTTSNGELKVNVKVQNEVNAY